MTGKEGYELSELIQRIDKRIDEMQKKRDSSTEDKNKEYFKGWVDSLHYTKNELLQYKKQFLEV